MIEWTVMIQKLSGLYITINNLTNIKEIQNRKFTAAWLSPGVPENVIFILFDNCGEVWQTKRKARKLKEPGLITCT